MTVHILGCGPAGLAAAHAAVMAGHDIRIFSNSRKSQMFGAQYLHKPLPFMVPTDCVLVRYRLQGTPEQYRRKVYGDGYTGTVSPEDLSAEHPAWDIRVAYDWLWNEYSSVIEDVKNINPRWMIFMRHLRPMISSVPLPAICLHPAMCNFREVVIWAAGEAPERGIRFMVGYGVEDNTVVCNGLETPAWYRASRIFDRTTLEWPRALPVPTLSLSPAAVAKPVASNCQCWPDVLKVGRYGKWQKGVLVHQAYEEAHAWLQSL